MTATTDTIQNHPMFPVQIELENEMRSLGIDRYQRAAEARRQSEIETGIKSVRRLLSGAHDKVVEGIKGFVAEAETGKAGRRHTAAAMLRDLDIDMVAHLALREVLDSISRRNVLIKTALTLGGLIEDELRFELFESKEPHLYRWTVNDLIKHSQTERNRRSVMVLTMNRKGIEWQGWSRRDKTALGVKLVEIVAETTGLVALAHYKDGPNSTAVYVEATQTTLDWLATEDGKLAALSPLYLPMVVPPKPWQAPTGGGYWSDRYRKTPLVKTNNRAYREELESIEMPLVYAALNAMQDTAWAVNRRVLDVMAHLWTQQSTLANIPSLRSMEPPPKPGWLSSYKGKDEMSEAQKEEFRAWKRAAKAVHQGKAKAISKRVQFARMMWVAERFAGFEALYFPHQLDFRGRTYAVPLFLNPQGNDACRGLLEFANGVPLGDQEGADWLAIHGANTYGVDKVSFEDRLAWVQQHEARILACAEDPLADLWWADADKPWQFLAFCFEWQGYRQEGFDFVSSLPVAMDGTCNGLQHFSAMLRDPRGGAAVNLVPSDRPQDIYMEVAKLVAAKAQADAVNGNEIAVLWNGLVGRKAVKRPVMTLAYGAKQYGFRQQVFDDTVSPLREECMKSNKPYPFDGKEWDAAAYLGTATWDCVGEVVVAARAAMEWLQEAARVVSREGLPIRWTTPAGLPVQQAYKVINNKRLELTFQTVRLTVSVDQSSDKLDARRQASALAPNFVHSLDAAHLMRTVSRCHDEGIRSFALIHDSYATHAGNTWMLARALREEFVRLHTDHDVLADLKAEMEAQLPEGVELPPLPEKGSLDLSQVLESPFFFA